MDYPTELQERMDASANLAAMQRTARQRLDDGTFSHYPARPATDEQGESDER
jgi:hypothetical protein